MKLFGMLFAALCALYPFRAAAESRAIDFVDPVYGARVRQLFNPAGDEHGLYHYRGVFNADNSRMLAIETPRGETDYHVTLYDGDGRFLKRLFTQAEYDWTVAWDRRDPRFFYTHHKGTLYRYEADAAKAEALRVFPNSAVQAPTGLSLNQQGDRLLLRLAGNRIGTYRLPAMDDERLCAIAIPDGYYANWDKLRFTGCNNDVALSFAPAQPPPPPSRQDRGTRNPDRRGESTAAPQPFTRIYDGATGALLHTLEGVWTGHHDFSPDGKMAYVEGFNQGRDMQARVTSLDGADNRIVFSAPRERLRHVRNYHITWPAGVSDWFLLSLFPQEGRLPEAYEPYLDEIIQVYVDGRSEILARTGTACGADFWAQPQQSPSADGSRILFSSNGGAAPPGLFGGRSSGTIDLFILYRRP